jgi:hypothetical protein
VLIVSSSIYFYMYVVKITNRIDSHHAHNAHNEALEFIHVRNIIQQRECWCEVDRLIPKGVPLMVLIVLGLKALGL